MRFACQRGLPGGVRREWRVKFAYQFPGVSVWKRGNRQGSGDPWLLSYRDPVTKKRTTITASPDATITARQAREISRRIDMHRLGQLNPRIEKLAQQEDHPLLGRWVEGVFIPGHAEAYRDWMIATGRSAKQAKEVYSRARKMIRLCHWRTIGDVVAAELEEAVANYLRERRNRSYKTCNDYLKAPAQLMRWMARPKVGRARRNPLADIEKYNQEIDRRRPRRVLSAQQFAHFLEVVVEQPRFRQLTGPDRVLLYLTAAYTGLRRSELWSLTAASFDLDSDPPTVTVDAAHSKHRRTDVQILRADLAERLRPRVRALRPGERLFKLHDRTSAMIRLDLAAAGIAFSDDEGTFDFHSLRHTFGTELARTGASLSEVQRLMRHSDPRLTARYVHPHIHDQERALDRLPALPVDPDEQQQQQATGTYGAQRDAQHPNRVMQHSGSPKALRLTAATAGKKGDQVMPDKGFMTDRGETDPDRTIGLRNRGLQVRVLPSALIHLCSAAGWAADPGKIPAQTTALDLEHQAGR